MSYTKEKRKEYAKKHYLKNKAKYQQSNQKRRDKARSFVTRYKRLAGIKCKVCGEARWQCLEFDHRNAVDKSFAISMMIKNRKPIKLIKEEIRKCDVLCANCHRIRHNGCVWENA